MSDIKLPPEVVEAAAMVLHANAEIFNDILWDALGEYDQDAYREEATAALRAGLKAWPGMQTDCERRVSEKWIGVREFPVIILPLHQEAGDEG